MQPRWLTELDSLQASRLAVAVLVFSTQDRYLSAEPEPTRAQRLGADGFFTAASDNAVTLERFRQQLHIDHGEEQILWNALVASHGGKRVVRVCDRAQIEESPATVRPGGRSGVPEWPP